MRGTDMFLNKRYVREDIMAVDQVTEHILIFSRPFARYGHIKIGSRATAIKYGNGQIATVSLPRFTDNVMCALEHHFGSTDVRFIMALNSDDLWAWGRMFPFAKIVASEDAILTRSKKGYLELDSQNWATISSENKNGFKTGDAAFDAEFESMYLDHTQLKEVLWLHKMTSRAKP